MKNFITNLDFLGYQEAIKVKGHDKYQTLFGALLSLIVIILSIVMTITLGLELFLKTEPMLINSKKKFDSVGPFNISKEGIDIYISMEYANFTYYMDETVYTVKAIQTVIQNIIEADGNVTQDLHEVELDIIKCSDYLTKEDVIAKQIGFPYEVFYCIKPNQAQVVGFWTADLYKAVRIDIQKCLNTTEIQKCKPIEEIDSIVQNGFMEVFISDYNIDPKSNDEYLLPYYYDLFQTISAENGLIFYVSIEELNFSTDKGLIFHDYIIDRIPKITDVRPMYIFGERTTIAEIIIEGTSFGDIYNRSYAKAQDLLTRIGGLIKALSILGYFINFLYCKAFFIVESFNLHHQIIERVQQQNDIESMNMKSLEVIRFSHKNLVENYRNNNNSSSNISKTLKTGYTVVKYSQCRLLSEYLCGRNGKSKVKKILVTFYELFKKSLSVEVFYRNYVDIKLLKFLLFNNEDLKTADKLFVNLLDENNVRLNKFNDFLGSKKVDKDKLMESKNITEQLKLLNDIY
jgi:hypothetical protein